MVVRGVRQHYISVLPRQGDHGLSAFEVLGAWEPVEGDLEHQAVDTRWKDPQKAQEDPRRLVLMRRLTDTDPTRVYAGCIPTSLSAGAVPFRFRQRWQHQERVKEDVLGWTRSEDFQRDRTEFWLGSKFLFDKPGLE